MSEPITASDASVWGPPEGLAEQREAAELVYESFAEYYQLFSSNQSALMDALVSQLEEPSSEIGQTHVLRNAGDVVGVCSWCVAEELTPRQMVSLRMLLDLAEDPERVLEGLESYRLQVAPIADGSLYLARIAVTSRQRGAGFGRSVLARFESQARRLGRRRAALHVRANNAPALRFYRAAGYECVSPAGLDYLTLEKAL